MDRCPALDTSNMSNMEVLLLIAELNKVLIQRLTPPPVPKEATFEELVERFGDTGTKQVPTETGYLEVLVPVSPSPMQQHNETYNLIAAATADGCPEDPVKWTGEQIEKHPEVFDLLNTPTPVA